MEDNSREVVGTFHDVKALEEAANVLMSSGFDRSALSLIATEVVVQKQFGSRLTKVEKLEDHPDTPRIAYMNHDDVAIGRGALISGFSYLGAVVGTVAVLTSGGALLPAVAVAAAGGVGGGSLGALLGSWLNAETAKKISDEVERGGLILWVRTHSPDEDDQASDIMISNGAYGVHAHAGGAQASSVSDAETMLAHPGQDAGQDTDIARRLKRDPTDMDAQLDRGLDESMDASDPPAAATPGDSGEPLPSSGFNEEEERQRSK
ncbi:MAG: hypothetical protein JWO15_1165 [Sphingomonadales bacterium]|nr:hypothetical protein [Sphingomonadales bacterium]